MTGHPRAIGRVDIDVKNGPEPLAHLRQSGCMRVLFPRMEQGTQAVLLNTAGGVTGGDRLAVHATSDGNLTLTTQAAERIYRAQAGETGEIRNHLTLGENGCLNWLPQETILFEGCNLNRSLQVDMAADARFLMVEPLVFGRALMGETLHTAQITDNIRIRRDGELVFADALRLQGDIHSQLQNPAVADGAGAMASLLLIDPAAETRLDALRRFLPKTAGASLIRPGVLFARILAQDSFDLRKTLVPALRLLHGGDLPRTWSL